MAINIHFYNSNVQEDGIRVYRSLTPFDKDSLPSVYATLPAGSQSFVDEDVSRGDEYYYVLEVYRGSDSDFTSTMLGKALPTLSGVGPTTLIGGDSRAGFYGEVPASEFITGNALASQMGLTAGVAQNSDVPWLKYVLDGKTLLIPMKSHRHTISWDMINAVNLVFGTRTITIAGEAYKVRLLKGLNDNTPNTVSNGYDILETHFSEWNRLIYPTVIDNPIYPQTSQIGPDWASYTETELVIINTGGNGSYTWCQETNALDATRRVGRGATASSNFTANASSYSNTSAGWRACLELVS